MKVKKVLVLVASVFAGALIYRWILDNTGRDLWDDVHDAPL